MLALGIEGTAHTIGVGIIEYEKDMKVLADSRKTYIPKAGIHPREAAQFMGDHIKPTLNDALARAKLEFPEIDLISFSQGPGLGPCLRTVATVARALSLYHNIPLLGVNHCVAHIEIGGQISGFKNPLVLYVSGANTQILMLKGSTYRIFGETLDVGIGNMLDKFGRAAGLEHPAGPKIEELARKSKNYIELPYTVKGTDMNFSGVLTAAEVLAKGHALEDVCFSLQETTFAMLAEVTERALCHLGAKEVLLTGGVGNNIRLQEMLALVAKGQGAKFSTPKGFLSDNGVMIALVGAKMHKAGVKQALEETKVIQGFRTDEVVISW